MINKLKPWNGSFWNNDELKELKTEIRTHLLKEQDNRCAYCGNNFFVTSSSEIEHIAPKGGEVRKLYPQFTFTPYNLVLACTLCNSPIKKGSKKTIDKLNINYKKCKFNIIHPYFDEPSDHLSEVVTSGGIIYVKKTDKGSRSIEMFSLNDESQIKARTDEMIISLLPEEIKKQTMEAFNRYKS